MHSLLTNLFFNKVLTRLKRITKIDAYGNVVCPFAKKYAVGDFEFDHFLPRCRGGTYSDRSENCVVTQVRFYNWKGAKIPHLIPPEDTLVGATVLKVADCVSYRLNIALLRDY